MPSFSNFANVTMFAYTPLNIAEFYASKTITSKPHLYLQPQHHLVPGAIFVLDLVEHRVLEARVPHDLAPLRERPERAHFLGLVGLLNLGSPSRAFTTRRGGGKGRVIFRATDYPALPFHPSNFAKSLIIATNFCR